MCCIVLLWTIIKTSIAILHPPTPTHTHTVLFVNHICSPSTEIKIHLHEYRYRHLMNSIMTITCALLLVFFFPLQTPFYV